MTATLRLPVATLVAVLLMVVAGGLPLGVAVAGRTVPAGRAGDLHGGIVALAGILAVALALAASWDRGVRRPARLVTWGALALFAVHVAAGQSAWLVAGSRSLVAMATAQGLVAATVLAAGLVVADKAAAARSRSAGNDVRAGAGIALGRSFAALATLATTIVLALMLTGSWAEAAGPTLACPEWPTCRAGTVFPTDGGQSVWPEVAHRAVAALGVVAVLAMAALAWRRASRLLQSLTVAASALVLLEALVGADLVLSVSQAGLSALHLATGTLLWATMVAILFLVCRGGTGPARVAATAPAAVRPTAGMVVPAQVTFGAPALATAQVPAVTLRPAPLAATGLARFGATINDYTALTKPNILSLLLVTTLGAMLVAAEGIPTFALVFWTMLGGTLAAGGANAINCFVDRDIDAVMRRTQHRATAAGRISPTAALTFGLALSALAVGTLAWLVNPLAAGLALAGNLFYVLVYTCWLKRTTPQNIVIGGAAGAVPPLVGWAAVTGSLDPVAWLLFAIIFFWTPPHFWALALLKYKEYDSVSVPMLPVVAGEEVTRRQIVIYSALLALVALLPLAFGLGWVYALGSVVLNGLFLGKAIRLWRTKEPAHARDLFFFSLWYLAVIFAAAVADRLILA